MTSVFLYRDTHYSPAAAAPDARSSWGGLELVLEPPLLEGRGPHMKEAMVQISHEVQSYTALAVVSAVFATSNLGTLRSVSAATFAGGGFLVELVMAVSLVTSTMLSLYSTMVSSLLRYYGYVATARAQGPLWIYLGTTPVMILVKKTCFWAFIGSFVLSLIELSIISVVKFSRHTLIQAILVVVSVTSIVSFIAITSYILLVARWLFAPSRPPAGYTAVPTVSTNDVEEEDLRRRRATRKTTFGEATFLNDGSAEVEFGECSAEVVDIDAGEADGGGDDT